MSEAPKKPAKVVPAHPPYREMIKAAINALKERGGSSRQAILKYIAANYKVKENVDVQVKIALRNGVKKGDLVQTKGTGASGSFKNAVKVEPKKPKKVAPKKKPAVKKPAAKSAAAKKKTAAKKPAAKKTGAKKAGAKKSPAKKAGAKKTAAGKKSPKKAAKKPVAKKTPKKTGVKKASKAKK